MDERHKETMNKLSNLEYQNNILLSKNDNLIDKVDTLETKITENNIKIETSTKEIDEQFNKLSLTIPPSKKRDIHYFVIINRGFGSYYCIRRKYESLKSELKRIGGDIIYYIQTGNAFSLYDALKNSDMIFHSGNCFRMKNNNNEMTLFIFIKNKLKDIGEPIENIKESMKYLKIDLDDIDS
jgi:hypothetical protein